MKQIYILIIFSLLLIFINSCDKQEKNYKKNSAISVNIDNIEKEAQKVEKLSYFVNDFKIIPLEANKESYIGRIKDIQIINDTIYILDSHGAKTLFLFGIDGKYLNKISRIGKGPGEFMNPNDFDVDPIKSEIMIYDAMSSKIIVYNKETKYLRDINLKKRINNFIFHDGYYYIYNKPISPIDNKIIHKLNPNGRIIWSVLDSEEFIKRKYGVSLIGGNFFKFNDEIIFWRDIHPYIYSIKNEIISPKFKIATKNYKISKEKAMKSFYEVHKSDMLHQIQEYSENSEYTLFNYSIGRSRTYIFYDKSNKKIYYSYYRKFKDDLSNLYPNYFRLLDDNRMLGIVPVNSSRFKDKMKELNINNEHYNPILILYYLK